MQIPTWTKPALLGAAAGAVGLAIVGFSSYGLAGSAVPRRSRWPTRPANDAGKQIVRKPLRQELRRRARRPDAARQAQGSQELGTRQLHRGRRLVRTIEGMPGDITGVADACAEQLAAMDELPAQEAMIGRRLPPWRPMRRPPAADSQTPVPGAARHHAGPPFSLPHRIARQPSRRQGRPVLDQRHAGLSRTAYPWDDAGRAEIARDTREHAMKPMIFAAGLVTSLLLLAPAASAASCWDLWYERNAIYDANGFCFSTSLGKRTFDNSDCWTKNPRAERLGEPPRGRDPGRKNAAAAAR